jgi:predicted PurR-regulated permease PerM
MSDSQKWLLLTGLFIGAWVLYLLRPVLMPFMVAALLAYLGDPLVDWLERRKLSRTLSVLIVFTGMTLAGLILLLVMLPILQRQIVLLIENIPNAIALIREQALSRLTLLEELGVTIDLDVVRQALASHWQEVGGFLTNLIANVSRQGQALLGWLVYLVLIPVVTFYLLRDWDVLLANVRDLLPRRCEPAIAAIAGDCDKVLAEFLRGQLTVMATLALLYIIGLWVVGIDLAFVIGIVAGLVSFVPYLGVIIGIVLAGFAAALQFHDIVHLIGVAVVFGLGQVLEGMVLSPLLVGDRIGLHPVAVIFAVMAGGQLFGFAGVLLALPVAAVIVVLLRHAHRGYVDSSLYTR